MIVSIVVATTEDGVIGINGKLPWKRISSDMEQFRRMTIGHPVVMGRKTYDSIPTSYRPLAKRTNIILSRTPNWSSEGCITAVSPAQALAYAANALGSEEVFIVGGSEIYRLFLPFTDRIFLSRIKIISQKAENQSIFDPLDTAIWESVVTGTFSKGSGNDFGGTFHTFSRRTREEKI